MYQVPYSWNDGAEQHGVIGVQRNENLDKQPGLFSNGLLSCNQLIIAAVVEFDRAAFLMEKQQDSTTDRAEQISFVKLMPVELLRVPDPPQEAQSVELTIQSKDANLKKYPLAITAQDPLLIHCPESLIKDFEGRADIIKRLLSASRNFLLASHLDT